MARPRRLWQLLVLCLALGPTVWAAEPASRSLFAARAGQAFADARKAFANNPLDEKLAWTVGRTSFDWAEFATNWTQRAEIARVGIAACTNGLLRLPNAAIGHYYLAMNYGELAEAEEPSLEAYRLIREIEREFKTAAKLDETLDFAGPDRCLGLLYRDAPGWPISIGSRREARKYLDRAAALAPGYPENQLNLVESSIKWRQAGDAERAWKKLSAIWPAATTNLTGVVWEASWYDWGKRRDAAQKSFAERFDRPLKP